MTETSLRLFFFFGVLSIMLVWQLISPRRKDKLSITRGFNNIFLIFLNSVTIKLLFPITAVGIALWCSNNNIGLLNLIDIPSWLKIICAFLILDLAIYTQHVIFHHVPALWRIHRAHHADMGFDVTTGLRFHPIEIILSMLIKFSVICFIGAPALAVIIFEIVLNATAMFNHSNINLNTRFDKFLRLTIVTPDMHRVHHSTIPKETHSNFSFNLPIWDRIFGTYIAQPKENHLDMDIGLKDIRSNKRAQSLLGILSIPFLKK